MFDKGQALKKETPVKGMFLDRINKTPLIFAVGVLLIIASNFLFKKMNLKVEPIDSWDERTLLVIRAKEQTSFWQAVKEILQTMDPEFNTAIDKIKLKTGESPLDLAEEILPNPIELVIMEKNNFEKNGGLKYDFVLVTESSGTGIENLPAADAAAKDFSSWFIPINRYITLDDGSKVKTQIADPKTIKVQKEVFNNEDIIYINEAGLPFEYARSHSGAWLFFGTSKKSIEDIVAKHNQTIPFEILSRNCASPNKSVNVFFNPNTFRLFNRTNILIIGSPLRGFFKLINRNKTIIRINGISISWESCLF